MAGTAERRPADKRPRRSAAALFARGVVLLRFPVVVAWIGGAVAAGALLPTLTEAQTGALGDLVPADAEAIETERRSVERFGFPVLSRTLVVQREPGGLSVGEQERTLERAIALNREGLTGLDEIAGALVTANTLGEPPFSREESTTAITYLFFPPEVGQFGRTNAAQELVDTRIDADPGAVAGVTGTIPARAAQGVLTADHVPLVELLTVLLVGLAVAVHFRAVGASVLNLVAVAVAYLIAIRVVASLGEAVGISVPSEVEPVIVVLLFGVITDYSIFFMSRFRQAVDAGEDRQRAAERVTTELLPIVVTAGLTIIGGSAALVLARLGFLQAFGPGLALSVAVGLLVAITFVPAALAIGGRILFWPATGGRRWRRRRRKRRRRRSRSIELATRRPVAVAAASTALLLIAASGLAFLEPANPLIRGLPAESEAKRAYNAASKGFAPGILAPTVLLIEAPGITEQRSQLAELQRRLEAQQGVAEAVGPADQPFERPEFGALLSETGDAARYVLVLNADPLGRRAIAILRSVERRLPRLLEQVGLGEARASFAGDTALVAETVERTFDDLAAISPVIALVVFVVLAVFLRALVAPLYLLLSSVLALCAALGLTIYLFQEVLGYGEITYFVPFAAAVLLVSLGSDYNVFLVGRIWGEARRRPIHRAIAAGGASAAAPITAAGLVLAGSFALLAVVPVRSFRELAFAMSAGLLIDAFVVRTLLVPALMTLAGRLSAWPSGRLEHASRDG